MSDYDWAPPDSPWVKIGNRCRGDILLDLAGDNPPDLNLDGLDGMPLVRVYEGTLQQPKLLGSLASSVGLYVYVLTGRKGFIYVGQTSSPSLRLIAHRKQNRFWGEVRFASIFVHQYSGLHHSELAEILELERSIIADVVPIFNRDRTSPECSQGAPWLKVQREAEIRAGALA